MPEVCSTDDSICDNLNRAISLGGAAVTNDILGNRITKGGVTYGWDVLNRMTSLSGSVTASYAYRADRMRVSKQTGGVTTTYRHDAQMGIEDVEIPTSGTATVTRYGLGARGIDMIERTNGSGTVTAFPLYDAHGNNVASLIRSGTGFSIGDRRTYDAWGVVRSQQSAGDPKLRYCANLGHKADDESGLTYMRARYYEPSSGRFISEDPSTQGRNWFAYCVNNPVNKVDRDGRVVGDAWSDIGAFLLVMCIGLIYHGSAEAMANLLKLRTDAYIALTQMTVPTGSDPASTLAQSALLANSMLTMVVDGKRRSLERRSCALRCRLLRMPCFSQRWEKMPSTFSRQTKWWRVRSLCSVANRKMKLSARGKSSRGISGFPHSGISRISYSAGLFAARVQWEAR